MRYLLSLPYYLLQHVQVSHPISLLPVGPAQNRLKLASIRKPRIGPKSYWVRRRPKFHVWVGLAIFLSKAAL
uniref:Uncharacterized protein n=1 Tax=Solanum tuberosum TaxID=4113 RepID=M1CCF0_SOLTU